MHSMSDQIDRGLALLRNLKINDAKELFATLIQETGGPHITGDNIWVHFHHAEVLFYQSMLLEDREMQEATANYGFTLEQMTVQLMSKNDDFIPKNAIASLFSFGTQTVQHTREQLFKQERVHKECQLALAELYLGMSLMRLRQLSYVKGAYYLRKSWKAYETLMVMLNDRDDKQFQGRVKFGVGVFHFVISLVPPTFLWIIEIVGFHADREKALTELKIASECNCRRSTEALVLLTLFDGFFLDKKEEASEMMQKILQQYPTGGIYKMLAAMMERRNGTVTKAIEFYQGAIADAVEGRQLQLTANYELAHCYFLANEWEKAIPGIILYLSESKSSNFRAYGGFKLGFCYWMTKQHDKIEEVYKKVPGWVRPNFSFDRYALRKVNTFMESKMYTAFDELAIAAFNLVEGKFYEQGLITVEKIPELIKNGYTGPENLFDCWGLYHYLKGCCQRGTQQFQEAKKSFSQAVALSPHLVQEKYVVPHSLTEVGEMFIEEKKFTEAKLAFQDAKSFPTPYDFDRPLSFRISKGLQNVK